MASSTPNDTSLLDIGKKCSSTHCGTIDFLPFKCEHCTQPFCADHFRVDDHKCSNYDASKHNRVAPHCPLCDEPIAIPPGQDPIIRLQDHVDNKCPVMTGKKPGSTSPRCGNKRCNKVLIQPIRCDQCRKQFCPSHRWPSDHTCVTSTPSTPPTKSPGASFTTASEGVKKSAADVSAKATAASAAIKRTMANANAKPATANVKPSNAPSSGAKSPPIDNPFSKSNRVSSSATLSPTSTSASTTTSLPPPLSPLLPNYEPTPTPASTSDSSSSTLPTLVSPLIPSILDVNSYKPRSIFAAA